MHDLFSFPYHLFSLSEWFSLNLYSFGIVANNGIFQLVSVRLPGETVCLYKTFIDGARNGNLIHVWAPSSRGFSFLFSHALTKNDLCITELMSYASSS